MSITKDENESTFHFMWRLMQHEAYTNSVNKGFWEDVNSLAALAESAKDDGQMTEYTRGLVMSQKLKLMDDELSEAHEAVRSGNPDSVKAEGFSALEEELADVVIRMWDFCGKFDLDVAGAIEAKMAYNAGRPYKHGRKFA